ncbi:MAG: radical SAM protein [Coriobacteriales bacterium]|jgi:MoaA/NifB/PqqE/SkfB family radical SAM enzyme
MDLNAFMNEGVDDILKTARHYYTRSFRGTRYLAHAAKAMMHAVRLRSSHEKSGLHVPPFLIASIASECNLDCVGCYAHAFGTIGDAAGRRELSAAAWEKVFLEAERLGVSFILLAGGEPTMRRDVIEMAASHPDIIFPIFTNGTLLDDSYRKLFDDHRNLIPLFSIEGTDGQTDARRGAGVAAQVRSSMEHFSERGILWGISLTATTENVDVVTDDAFVRELYGRGCGTIIYNEFVPVQKGTAHLALDLERHNALMARMDELARDPAYENMVTIAFPGNEELMGGCLAAGRGFFHIAQDGAIEPCPFSPFSVANIIEVGLEGALRSPFFERVREIEAAHSEEHMGGCTLFLHENEVRLAMQQ